MSFVQRRSTSLSPSGMRSRRDVDPNWLALTEALIDTNEALGMIGVTLRGVVAQHRAQRGEEEKVLGHSPLR